MIKRLLAVLCVSLLLTGCGDSTTSPSLEESESVEVYATTIQKNNRTVRVKSDTELLADMTINAPTDEYVRYGFFYECYSLPDEIVRHEYVRLEEYVWSDDVNPILSDIFYHRTPGNDVKFRRYVLEDYFEDITNARTVSLAKSGPYENMWRITYIVDDVFYTGLLTQTVEDLEKGENVYSLYIGIESLPPE